MFNRNTLWFILLLFVPISIIGHWLHWDEVTIFIMASLGIIPLAAFMGEATEEIAVVVGPTLGGAPQCNFR
jgi:Ca2+/H+ antiporter